MLTHGLIPKSQFRPLQSVLLTEGYIKELNWIYSNFCEEEFSFRPCNREKLNIRSSHIILIGGCGLRSDLQPITEAVRPEGLIHARDLIPEMDISTTKKLDFHPFCSKNIYLSVSNAQNLHFADGI